MTPGRRTLIQWRNDVQSIYAPTDYAGVPTRTGLVTNFPEFEITKKGKMVPTHQSVLRQFEMAGQAAIRVSRRNRKRIQRLLTEDGHPEEAIHRSLDESSSEDGSDDEMVKIPAIDWSQADYGKKEPLHRLMSLPQMSSLVGWATHLSDDKYDSHSKIQNHSLLDLPNTPLQYCTLQYIKEKSVLTKPQEAEMPFQTQTFNSRSDEEVIHAVPRAWRTIERLEEDKESWTYGENDETYRWVKLNMKETRRVRMTALTKARGFTKVVEKFKLDISGQVALGMVVEEALTSVLMPMAKLHVARCQQIDNAFDDWTLPPDEAVILATNDTPCEEIAVDECSSTRDFVKRWAETRELEPNFVLKNMDIYSKLIFSRPIQRKKRKRS